MHAPGKIVNFLLLRRIIQYNKFKKPWQTLLKKRKRRKKNWPFDLCAPISYDDKLVDGVGGQAAAAPKLL